jgi:hypothetical protein
MQTTYSYIPLPENNRTSKGHALHICKEIPLSGIALKKLSQVKTPPSPVQLQHPMRDKNTERLKTNALDAFLYPSVHTDNY